MFLFAFPFLSYSPGARQVLILGATLAPWGHSLISVQCPLLVNAGHKPRAVFNSELPETAADGLCCLRQKVPTIQDFFGKDFMLLAS